MVEAVVELERPLDGERERGDELEALKGEDELHQLVLVLQRRNTARNEIQQNEPPRGGTRVVLAVDVSRQVSRKCLGSV